jgi:Asparaginase
VDVGRLVSSGRSPLYSHVSTTRETPDGRDGRSRRRDIPAELAAQQRNGSARALGEGLVVLKRDGSAMDAVIAAIVSMDSGLFDAGCGS